MRWILGALAVLVQVSAVAAAPGQRHFLLEQKVPAAWVQSDPELADLTLREIEIFTRAEFEALPGVGLANAQSIENYLKFIETELFAQDIGFVRPGLRLHLYRQGVTHRSLLRPDHLQLLRRQLSAGDLEYLNAVIQGNSAIAAEQSGRSVETFRSFFKPVTDPAAASIIPPKGTADPVANGLLKMLRDLIDLEATLVQTGQEDLVPKIKTLQEQTRQALGLRAPGCNEHLAL